MYDKEFFRRVSLQQMACFFQSGVKAWEMDTGSLAQRYRRWETAFLDALVAYRDAVLAAEWPKTMTEYERQEKTEELYDPVTRAGGNWRILRWKRESLRE